MNQANQNVIRLSLGGEEKLLSGTSNGQKTLSAKEPLNEENKIKKRRKLNNTYDEV